jgi:hypothetical protein
MFVAGKLIEDRDVWPKAADRRAGCSYDCEIIIDLIMENDTVVALAICQMTSLSYLYSLRLIALEK